MMSYAIFTRRERGRTRVMHAAREGAWETLCGHPVGRGSGLVRDGDYRDSRPCGRCWPEDVPGAALAGAVARVALFNPDAFAQTPGQTGLPTD